MYFPSLIKGIAEWKISQIKIPPVNLFYINLRSDFVSPLYLTSYWLGILPFIITKCQTSAQGYYVKDQTELWQLTCTHGNGTNKLFPPAAAPNYQSQIGLLNELIYSALHAQKERTFYIHVQSKISQIHNQVRCICRFTIQSQRIIILIKNIISNTNSI